MTTTPGAQAPETPTALRRCTACGKRSNEVELASRCASTKIAHRWAVLAPHSASVAASRHRDAICIAAHIASESPGKNPAVLAASAERLWNQTMWRAVATEAGIAAPDTATQALAVSILRGLSAEVPPGGAVLTLGAAATAHQALLSCQRALTANQRRYGASPCRDQQLAKIRDALDELSETA